jgi:hypothetical protein
VIDWTKHIDLVDGGAGEPERVLKLDGLEHARE